MISVLLVCLLLLYYWYFYLDMSAAVSKPGIPLQNPHPPYAIHFLSDRSNQFKFVSNGVVLWHHTLPETPYVFHQDRIVQQDVCHLIADGLAVIAKGRPLYDYLKTHPDLINKELFQEHGFHPVRDQHVFYFTCLKGRIDALHICASGSVFLENRCHTISPCIGKPNGVRLSLPVFTHYIECENEHDIIHSCPEGTYFHFNQCLPRDDFTNYCKFNKDYKIINEYTKLECRWGEPHYSICPSGMKYFDQPFCEPDTCYGYPDTTKLPLSPIQQGPFIFNPGYMQCKRNKIEASVECPPIWDDILSKGDNLTSLPMVFDGQKCAIPAFCENVFSNDPDVIVPMHDFSKYVKNWALSDRYDSLAGYRCDPNRKRKMVRAPNGHRISKKFKFENACEPATPLIPLYGNPSMYYDCQTQTTISCPPEHVFNGTQCIPTLTSKTFQFKGIPLFHWNSFLNNESWISPWEYKSNKTQGICTDPEAIYLPLYDICSHPDCTPFAFLSMIPDLALFLPPHTHSKCTYDETTHHLQKSPASSNVRFWDQKEVQDGGDVDCTPGQTLQTGNFIWDQTIFATCHLDQPFLFCPASDHILRIQENLYACEPPPSNIIPFSSIIPKPFMSNEVKSIQAQDELIGSEITLKRNSKPIQIKEDILDLQEGTRLNLSVSHPVDLYLRYRVTYPPHVAFEYDDQDIRKTLTSTPDRGFLPRIKTFTSKALAFPRYKIHPLVDSFQEQHNIE